MRLFSLLSMFFIAALVHGCPGMLAQDVSLKSNPDNQAPLRTAPLPAIARNEIAAVIVKGLLHDGPLDPGGPTARQIALGSWVSFVKLSSDGTKVVQVAGGPDNPDNGATGNGDLWLFRLQGAHATLILSAGGSVYGPSSRIYHHGMLDYQTFWNMSCCDGSVEVYRFDGVRYKPLVCYEQTSDESGKWKESPHTKCPD